MPEEWRQCKKTCRSHVPFAPAERRCSKREGHNGPHLCEDCNT